MERHRVRLCFADLDNVFLQTPFASAAARARENAADGGQPLLAGRAVHIMRSACAKQSGDGPAALASMALAHGAKVGHYHGHLRMPRGSWHP